MQPDILTNEMAGAPVRDFSGELQPYKVADKIIAGAYGVAGICVRGHVRYYMRSELPAAICETCNQGDPRERVAHEIFERTIKCPFVFRQGEYINPLYDLRVKYSTCSSWDPATRTITMRKDCSPVNIARNLRYLLSRADLPPDLRAAVGLDGGPAQTLPAFKPIL
jgi:hypothetical protein